MNETFEVLNLNNESLEQKFTHSVLLFSDFAFDMFKSAFLLHHNFILSMFFLAPILLFSHEYNLGSF